MDSPSATTTVPAGYFTDGPGSRTVRGRIADKDGAFTIYTATVVIDNVAPTATFTGDAAVNEGVTATVSFSGQADPSAVDTAAGFAYSYDFDNDGTFEVTDSTSASAVVPAAFLDDGPHSAIVRARIKDKDGGFTDYTTVIVIKNVAPTGTLSNGGAVDEGSPGSVRFDDLFDPSATDRAAGYRYSYDFDNDGTFEVVDSTTASAVVPASYLDDGAGTRTIRARIKDKDNEFTDHTTTIAINNVAPTAALSGDASGVRGQRRNFLLAATDPSAADTAAGFTFHVNWGDGTTQTVQPGQPLTLEHVFTANGTYPIRVTAKDKDGGVSSEFTHNVTISSVALQVDHCDPTKMALVVGGTEADDKILINPGAGSGSVHVSINGTSRRPGSGPPHRRPRR
jgi:hypothetical protein